jgi:hypothetical protein
MGRSKVRVLLVCLVTCGLLFGACGGGSTGNQAPQDHLAIASTFHTYHLPGQVNLMSGITEAAPGQYLVCDPGNVFSLVRNGNSYSITRLTKPAAPSWNPVGLAYSNGQLYVANGAGKDVLEVRLTGNALTLVRRFTDASMHDAEAVVVSSDGEVTVTDQAVGQVLRFSPDGTLAWRMPLLGAHGLTESGGNLYVSSVSARTITELTAAGKTVRSAGKQGVSAGRYLLPVGLAAANGRIIVTDAHAGHITVLDQSLHVQKLVGGNGPGLDAFNFPFATLPSGGGYVVVDTFKQRLVQMDGGWTVQDQIALGATVPTGRDRPLVAGSDAHPYTYDSLPGIDLAASLGLQQPEKFVGALNGLDHIGSDGTQVHMDFTDEQFGATSVTWAQQVGPYVVVGSSQRAVMLVIEPASGMFTFVDVGPDSWWRAGALLLMTNFRRDLSQVILPAQSAFTQARVLLNQGMSRRAAFDQALAHGKPRDWSQDLHSAAAQTFLHSGMTGADASRYYTTVLREQQQSAVELLEVRYLSTTA